MPSEDDGSPCLTTCDQLSLISMHISHTMWSYLCLVTLQVVVIYYSNFLFDSRYSTTAISVRLGKTLPRSMLDEMADLTHTGQRKPLYIEGT